jgi:amino acid adenylation domain-containing protein
MPQTNAILHAEFAAQASRTPESVALWDRGSSITFATLNARADRLATLLRHRGVRDAFVGIHAERSIEYVVAVLGVLKAGCAVVPLPPSYPAHRLRQILDFAGLAAVVDVEASPLNPGLGVRVVHLADASTVAPDSTPSSVEDSNRAAYVLSSSGSTGHPKMIVRSHRSFFHRLRWTWEQHPYEPDEVCVQKSHMTTTHAIYELFEPMLRGVPVHIISDDEVRDLAAFWAAMTAHHVSRLLVVPSLLQASVDIRGSALPPLKILVLMGEHVPSKLAARAIELFPETAIFSIYGSTEASSALVCDVRASYRHGEELTLGVPISPDVCAVVLDESLSPVRAGASGMLHLGGPELFTEYHRDPALTASVRIERGGGALYRTNDEVRLLPAGDVEFIGRSDDTVKIRGARVDLREVENAIATLPLVQQCVVLATGGQRSSGSSLVAFVTPAAVDSRAVLDAIRSRLPSHMVPSAVVTLDVLPLTPSGKVDRRRLLAEFLAQSDAAASPPFASQTERLVADVWAKVLGHHRFDRNSSFFEVGGTSLDVFAVGHRLGDALSLDGALLNPMVFYRHPTLAELASYVDRVRAGDAAIESAGESILVTLKRGTNGSLPPLYLISSAGGTLGAYAKLVRALGGEREVIGVRDPYLWGARDPSLGFQAWVGQYVDAIRERQGQGPYYIAAYSSAGAFGYEIARRLRNGNDEVALLALVDPLALDRGSKGRFGYWALEARFRRPVVTRALRAIGQLRRAMPRGRSSDGNVSGGTMSQEDFERLASETRRNHGHLRRLSALLELNTGLPFALSAADLAASDHDGADQVLLNRIRQVTPDADLEMMRRLVVQYEIQVRAHHAYRLRPYDGSVSLFEPDGPHAGLESTQLRPYVRRLRARRLRLGARDGQSALDGAFPKEILSHYLCMRDDVFVAQLAGELSALMDGS